MDTDEVIIEEVMIDTVPNDKCNKQVSNVTGNEGK